MALTSSALASVSTAMVSLSTAKASMSTATDSVSQHWPTDGFSVDGAGSSDDGNGLRIDCIVDGSGLGVVSQGFSVSSTASAWMAMVSISFGVSIRDSFTGVYNVGGICRMTTTLSLQWEDAVFISAASYCIH